MASSKFSSSWLIWVILIIAAVFLVMVFKGKMMQADDSDRIVSEMNVEGSIKPSHTLEDQKAMTGLKSREAIVQAPHLLAPRKTFAIQVYSFKEEVRAVAAFEALKAKDYPAYVMVSDLGARGIWHRVRVGSYANEGEAQEALEKITADFKSGIIVAE